MHTAMPEGFVLGFGEIDRTMVPLVGGKGANLGELTRIDGVRVPVGFCVTTTAYRHALGRVPGLADHHAIGTESAELRAAIEAAPVPDDVAAAITGAVHRHGDEIAWAVRSSATAEDLPTASFAGQHDSFLGVVGAAAVVEHVRRCWASLFTERAVAYRRRNGIDHGSVRMAVVVQPMVAPTASGVLFTADPLTSNRTVTAIDAVAGLGDELVSGRVRPDTFRVRDGEVVERSTAADRPVLTDAQAVALAALGRRIEAHFGAPQDIEWCVDDEGVAIVQSRPITTLFPLPPADDGRRHVYVSVAHGQMMTEAMKPLGLSFWQLTAARPMLDAGGRLFVDVTDNLASAAGRATLLGLFGTSDPLMRDALETVLARPGFLPDPNDDAPPGRPVRGAGPPVEIATDPTLVTGLIEANEASVAQLRRAIAGVSGPALFDLILDDLAELRRLLFDPVSHEAVMAGMQATWWLNDHLAEWLGEKNAADRLTLSAPGNVTSEMGLALLDVADAIRPHPEVVALLRAAADDTFLDRLAAVPGGPEARQAIEGYLARYGMRCVGEIDITRPRWHEHPQALVPLLLAHVDSFEPGEAARRFERGRQEAEREERDVLQRLRAQPDGEARAEETKRMIDRVRTFIGYREYPKYGMVSRYAVYKDALLAEADRMVDAGVIDDREDIFFLTFAELHEVARTGLADPALVAARQAAFRAYEALTPPRVLTSDGEALNGAYRRTDLPPGALAGLAVSAGTVEGRARVVLDMADADLAPGDILVTAATDPSWSPLFVAAAGLVTEVGGLMTHGAVVAREYGLPAVVGVDGATSRIADGQRIRIDGTHGYVELL